MIDRDELIEQWATSAYLLYTSCLFGSPVPAVAGLLERMTHPQPGDWVLNISWIGNNVRSQRIGKLQEVKEESLIADWDEEAAGGPCPIVTFWYIEDVNGIQRRWNNCDVITIFDDIRVGDDLFSQLV